MSVDEEEQVPQGKHAIPHAFLAVGVESFTTFNGFIVCPVCDLILDGGDNEQLASPEEGTA